MTQDDFRGQPQSDSNMTPKWLKKWLFVSKKTPQKSLFESLSGRAWKSLLESFLSHFSRFWALGSVAAVPTHKILPLWLWEPATGPWIAKKCEIALGTRRPFTGVSRALRARNPEKVRKKSRKSLEKVWKKSWKGPERLFRDFFQTLWGVPGPEAPGDFLQTFSGFRARRARETPCKWPTDSQKPREASTL